MSSQTKFIKEPTMEAFGIVGMTFGMVGLVIGILAYSRTEDLQYQIERLESALEKLKDAQ